MRLALIEYHTIMHSYWLSISCLLLGVSFVIAGSQDKDNGDDSECNKRPLLTTTPNLEADGTFTLSVEGIDKDNLYKPGREYLVTLNATTQTLFKAFMISAVGDVEKDSKNPRKSIRKSAGRIAASNNAAKLLKSCPNSAIQTSTHPKKFVQVKWVAPQSGEGCVTLRSIVAVDKDTWYAHDGPLSLQVCEDKRKDEDILPSLNLNCNVCDDAKYRVIFTGLWSQNTHPKDFPNDTVNLKPHFGDMVGASHNQHYKLWDLNNIASEGLKQLAEKCETYDIKQEIMNKLREGYVRTLISARGMPWPKLAEPVSSLFRTNRTHHLISVVAAIIPSPDWFVGTSKFELCNERDEWIKEAELNLYPYDAGTDSCKTFDGPREETIPRAPISSHIPDDVPIAERKPYARLRVQLLRTYKKTDCGERLTEEPTTENEETMTEESSGAVFQTSRNNGGQVVPENSDQDDVTEGPLSGCPLTPWSEWSPCTATCGQGTRIRTRFHEVKGRPYNKYNSENRGMPSAECRRKYDNSLFEMEECEINECSTEKVS